MALLGVAQTLADARLSEWMIDQIFEDLLAPNGNGSIEAGFEVFNMLGEVGFERHVLTKGPYNTTSAWSEKVEWCRREFPDVAVTITEDKGLVYGRVLFDDWIPYILRWLTWRPRGLAVMLDWPHNRTIKEEDGREVPFEHPNVFRYRQGLMGAEHFDQLGQLRVRLENALNRKPGEYP